MARLMWLGACVAAVCASAFGGVVDTGPSGQLAPWRPAAGQAGFSTVNSVVRIANPLLGFSGTGSVIAKRTTRENGREIGWFAVLTADHVVWPNDPVFNLPGGFAFQFGDGGAQGSFGGAETIRFRAPEPVAQGGLNQPVDLAVMGVRYGEVDDFFRRVTPLDVISRRASDIADRNFTQMGYGGHGDFVAQVPGAGGTPAGMKYLEADEKKRFQNNRAVDVVNHEYTSPRNNVRYSFGAVRFRFDQPAAPPANYLNVPHLVGEGASFPGDSGGPFLDSSAVSQAVGAFTRPGAGSDWNPPGGTADMPMLSNGLFAVMSSGPQIAVNGIQPYGATFYGVHLTPELGAWISGRVDAIPSPSAGALVLTALAWGRRRRRSGPRA